MQRSGEPARCPEVTPLAFWPDEVQRAVPLKQVHNARAAREFQEARAATHRYVLAMVDGLAGFLVHVRTRPPSESSLGLKQLDAQATLAKRRRCRKARQPAADNGHSR